MPSCPFHNKTDIGTPAAYLQCLITAMGDPRVETVKDHDQSVIQSGRGPSRYTCRQVSDPIDNKNQSSPFQEAKRVLNIFRFIQIQLFPRTIPLWNSLPASVAEAPSLASFWKGLSTLSFQVKLGRGPVAD